MSSPRPISDIKKDLEFFVGSKIRLKANRGRNRIIERVGVLESTYPNIFVVKLDERKAERRVSYSYADVLTETVELFVYDIQDSEIRIASVNEAAE
ncbi:MAG: Veg family protein [Syntrophomonadaceae bacterium]|nr:Veg family protein [Syntrophomonadaceae bacterium]